jgi:hypothetical protein
MNPTRLGAVLVVIGAILIAVTIGAFAFFFYTQRVSTNVNDWGAFGSYVGGVLGASISILALIGSVIAIYLQQKTSRNEHNHRIASDLINTIERLENDIDSSLKELPVAIHYPDHKVRLDMNAFRILTGILPPEIATNFIPKYSEDPKIVYETLVGENKNFSGQETFEKLRLYEIFSTSAGKLRRIRSLLLTHKELTGHNGYSMYYGQKYKQAVERLRQAGYPVETWDDIN